MYLCCYSYSVTLAAAAPLADAVRDGLVLLRLLIPLALFALVTLSARLELVLQPIQVFSSTPHVASVANNVLLMSM
jgi:hypothetical protein